MLNVYMTHDILGHLSGPEYNIDPTPYREACIEIINLPLTCKCEVKDKKLSIKLWYRDEMNSRSKLYGEKEISLGEKLESDSDDITFLFIAAWKCVCSYLSKKGKLDKLCGMDENKEGVYFRYANKNISAKKVSGKDRPDLQCATPDGEVRMGRPYMDELMEQSRLESLPLEEKERQAEEGNVELMSILVGEYLEGDEPDPQKAVYWLRKLAEREISLAQYNLALHCAKGYGVDRSFEEAAMWMEKAAKNGDPDAPAAAREYRGIIENIKKAEEGDPSAMASLAASYMRLGGSLSQAGEGDDYNQSFRWATKAAEKDSPEGYWVLALAHEHGRGTEQNIEKAIEAYEKASDLGHRPSMHSLGCYYLRGDKVEKEEVKGFKLVIKSAAGGYGPAMRTVAGCYQYGHGTEKDLDSAIRWYDIAGDTMEDDELKQKAELLRMFQRGELPTE